MKILFLTHAFNGLAQRLFVELGALGHEVAIEIELAGAVVRVREGVAPSTLRLVLACLRGSTP